MLLSILISGPEYWRVHYRRVCNIMGLRNRRPFMHIFIMVRLWMPEHTLNSSKGPYEPDVLYALLYDVSASKVAALTLSNAKGPLFSDAIFGSDPIWE